VTLRGPSGHDMKALWRELQDAHLTTSTQRPDSFAIQLDLHSPCVSNNDSDVFR